MSLPISFYDSPKSFKLSDLAPKIDCQIRQGDNASLEIDSIAPIETATKTSLTFLTSRKYIKFLKTTNAAAIICPPSYADTIETNISVLISKDPYTSFAKAFSHLFPDALRPKTIMNESGISPHAHIHETAKLEDGVIIEAGAVIGRNATIGRGTHISPNVVIGANVSIGRDCSIGPNSSLMHCILGDNIILHSSVLIGNDGFGFAPGVTHTKVVQTGRVILQDNIELGAGTAIDRGTINDTIIGEGTKMDDHCLIGHNVIIGRHCLFAGKVAVAGSTIIEDYVTLGGTVAIADHIHIGKGATLAGASRVFAGDVPAGVRWGGSPARDLRHWVKEVSQLRRDSKRKD